MPLLCFEFFVQFYFRWWVQRRKINPEILGSVFSLCCRAGIDAALVKADFFFAGAPTIENKIEQKIKTLRWHLLRWRLTLSDIWGRQSLLRPPNPRSSKRWNLQNFSPKTRSDKLGGISGEDMRVILHSK